MYNLLSVSPEIFPGVFIFIFALFPLGLASCEISVLCQIIKVKTLSKMYCGFWSNPPHSSPFHLHYIPLAIFLSQPHIHFLNCLTVFLTASKYMGVPPHTGTWADFWGPYQSQLILLLPGAISHRSLFSHEWQEHHEFLHYSCRKFSCLDIMVVSWMILQLLSSCVLLHCM